MKTHLLLLAFLAFIILGMGRFLSLDAHWGSDEARWLHRSGQFMSAVKQGEFSKTLIAYHPGVTTMWIAGLRTFFREPRVDVPNLVRARQFIGIVVWIGIALVCILLYRLFGQWVTLASFACLIYSPLFLAQTRRVHTDALATIFILLTVLLFLLYCQNRQHHRMLIFSGIAFGLAMLSKSYALILLPWVPLCMFLFPKKYLGSAWTYIAEGICFLNCAVLTVLFIWPVFWTPVFGVIALGLLGLTVVFSKEIEKERCPIWLIGVVLGGLLLVCAGAIQTIWIVFGKVNWAVTTPHEVEHFFLGKVVNDPGWLFYPFVLTIKSTPLMLPLASIGCFLLWKQRKCSEKTSVQFCTALSLVASAILFTVCLSATSKKFSRYLLPIFPMLEILAAIGFVEVLKWSYRVFRAHFCWGETITYKKTLTITTCIGFFFIQIFPVLSLHPYYGTYYNLCWKVTDITKIITVGDASGLDIASNYLNQKSNVHQMHVQVSPIVTQIVEHYFDGHAYSAGSGIIHPTEYEVVYIRDSQIGRVPQTGTLNGELEVVITLNGIEHAWIYRVEQEKN